MRARSLFRRGDHQAAFRTLRAYLDELIATDNLQGTCVASIEFITMTAAIGRLQDSTRSLSFLDTTGLLDNTAWATLVASTRDTLAATPPIADKITDHRQALAHMHHTLGQLLTADS